MGSTITARWWETARVPQGNSGVSHSGVDQGFEFWWYPFFSGAYI